jgi:hypothetical protein
MTSNQTINGVLHLLSRVAESNGHAKLERRRTGRFEFITRQGEKLIQVVVKDGHGATMSRTNWTSDEFVAFLNSAEEIYGESLRNPS